MGRKFPTDLIGGLADKFEGELAETFRDLVVVRED